MSILVVGISFTTDEAEFLASVLMKTAESALPGSAERFWLDRLHNRVHQGMVDVVANDSAARLATSGTFAVPPPPPLPPTLPGALPGAPAAAGFCSCGHIPGSQPCRSRRSQGTHP